MSPRRILFGALLLALAALPPGARAQGVDGFNWGVSGGVTLPQSDAKDAYDNGWHGQLHAFYGFPALPFLGVRVDGSYNMMDAKKFDAVTGDARVISGTGNAVFAIALGPIRPYAIGGIGIYGVRLRSSLGGYEVSDSQTKFGWNAGVGLGFGLGRVTIFAEGRYHQVSLEGGNFTYVPVSVGVLIH